MKKNKRIFLEATIVIPQENTFEEVCGVMSDILFRLNLNNIKINCTELTVISSDDIEKRMCMRIYSNPKLEKHKFQYTEIIMNKVYKKLAYMFNTYIITAEQKGSENDDI